MKLVLFTKRFPGKTLAELADWGAAWGLDGFDLCVRPDYPVNPGNIAEALPAAVETFRARGLAVPVLTASGELTSPDDFGALAVLDAMDKAGVRLLQLGYFRFQPVARSYASEVERIRRIFAEWEKVSRRFNVKVCYHTHSNKLMGMNAGGLMHLLSGFDPKCIGAYLDTGHLVCEGEDFGTAVAMSRPYLSAVALKDVLLERIERNGHGTVKRRWVRAGEGMVNWTAVFDALRDANFEGPLSIHAEFRDDGGDSVAAVAREVAFIRERLRAKSGMEP